MTTETLRDLSLELISQSEPPQRCLLLPSAVPGLWKASKRLLLLLFLFCLLCIMPHKIINKQFTICDFFIRGKWSSGISVTMKYAAGTEGIHCISFFSVGCLTGALLTCPTNWCPCGNSSRSSQSLTSCFIDN